MNDEQHYIIEDPETHKTREVVVKRFWIVPHLIVLGVILLGLFSTIVLPKTNATLQPANPVTPLESSNAPVDDQPVVVIDPSTIDIMAETAIVYDVDRGEVLYSKAADRVWPLASMTKLMTALVAYEVLPDDTIVTVSVAAAAEQSGGTLKAGESFSLKRLADFALISSFNSAAHTLADSVGRQLGSGDPQQLFATAMNIRASEIGLKSMTFNNATGLDISNTVSGGYGSAEDVARLTEYIIENYPEILLPTVTERTRLFNTAGEFHEARNTNDIVTSIPNVLGSKTGFTDLAGGNLVMAYDAGLNRPIIIVVMGSTRNGRFADLLTLHDATKSILQVKN